MNIFKALSEGNGRISETNVTSFMSYLLNSTNEFKDSFFILFIDLIDLIYPEYKLCDQLGICQKSIRGRISYFSSKYIVSAKPEYMIQKNDKTKQIPDILLSVSLKLTGEDVMFLIIENKISKAAIKKGQVEKQMDYFRASDDYNDNKPVYSILITPDDSVSEKLYKSTIENNFNLIWLKWIDHNERSIEAILRLLIKYEHNAEIEPIDPNTQFIIKSFVDYIATEFSQKGNSGKNFSYNGFDEISEATIPLDGKNYIIKRYSNNMIRLFEGDSDEPLEVKVLPILRKINVFHNLDVDLYHPTGSLKNTQVFGKDIIDKWNNLGRMKKGF